MEKRSSDGKRKRDAAADRAVKGKKTYTASVGEKRANPRPVPGRPVPSVSSREKNAQQTSQEKTEKKARKVNKPIDEHKTQKPIQDNAGVKDTSVRLKTKSRRPVRRRRTSLDESVKEEKDILGVEKPDEISYFEAKTAEPPKKPPSPYVRKLKKVMLAILTIIVILGIFSVLAFTVFFKIDEVTVEGKTRYADEEIIKASQINTGDNLLLFNTGKAADNIMNTFPYIETVDVEKKLFNSINIKVTQAKPAKIVENEGKYVVLSKKGKIIEINDKKKYDVPAIYGAKLKNVKLSSKVNFKDENLKKYLDKVLNALDENDMIKEVSTVDISDTSGIKIIKKNGFRIIIGNFENVDYKIKTAAYIIKNNVKANAMGTLDVSLASAESGKSYLRLGEDWDEQSSEQNNSKPSDAQGSPSEQTSGDEQSESSGNDGQEENEYVSEELVQE